MSDFRDQIESLSTTEKVDLLDESLRSYSLGTSQREAVQDAVNLPVFWTPEADADVQHAPLV